MHSCIPALLKFLFVVLPGRALWDHPERNKTSLQTWTFSLQQPHGEAPPSQVQNLTSRISKLEKFFADEIATYTSLTAGIHSQYFFLYDKICQLEAGNSDVINWKIPSVKFVFDSAKIARPSTDPLLEPAQVLVVLSSGITPMDTTFSSDSTLMVLDPLLASVHQFYSPPSLLTTTSYFNGPSQSSSTLVSVIN